MINILISLKTAFKFAFVILIVSSILVFLGAPTFFGMVIITASLMMTVYIYSLIGFILGFCFKYFKIKFKDAPENTYN